MGATAGCMGQQADPSRCPFPGVLAEASPWACELRPPIPSCRSRSLGPQADMPILQGARPRVGVNAAPAVTGVLAKKALIVCSEACRMVKMGAPTHISRPGRVRVSLRVAGVTGPAEGSRTSPASSGGGSCPLSGGRRWARSTSGRSSGACRSAGGGARLLSPAAGYPGGISGVVAVSRDPPGGAASRHQPGQ